MVGMLCASRSQPSKRKEDDVFKNVYERRTPKWVEQFDNDGIQVVTEFTNNTVVR